MIRRPAARPSLALTATLTLLAGGCAKPPAAGVTEFTVDAPELAMAGIDADTGVWESTPWEGTPWLPFGARRQLRLEHALGRVPSAVLVYLSFDDAGTNPALAAGDLARVVEADERFVTVWNDTNGNYFARVVVF